MKRDVQIAANALKRELQARGSEVSIVTWPTTAGKGVDDLLATNGPEFVLDLIAKADFGPEEETGDISTAKLAEFIQRREYFARDRGGRLYHFDAGAYRDSGAAFIQGQVKLLMIRLKLAFRWTAHRGEEVVAFIQVDAPYLWDTPPADEINVLNGLLNLKTKQRRRHDPKFLSSIQLPVAFDPQAKAPGWKKFVKAIFPKDAVDLIWRILAWLITPGLFRDIVILLQGEGKNGKSALLCAVGVFLGNANIATMSLHYLEENRFATANLVGKIANIFSDLPARRLESSSVFKAITGKDLLYAERKFKDGFTFEPFCRLLFSANHFPECADASYAFFRRWVVIPFSRTFQETDPDWVAREDLDKALADPRELSGVLNMALDAWEEMNEYGFDLAPSIKEAQQEFQATTDPLAVWLDRNTEADPAAWTSTRELLIAYGRDCEEKGRPLLSDRSFGKELKRLRPKVERAKRDVEKQDVWGYAGIRLRDGVL